jgi:hypothetical protein
MGVESKIRELMEGAANRPKDKSQGDASSPAQGGSDANPEIQDLSGTGNAEGGLTSEVGKAASAKKGKDTTLPKGQGAGKAPNFDDKSEKASGLAAEEVETEEEEVISEEEADVVEDVIAEEEEVVEEEITEEELSVEETTIFEADLKALFADEDHLTEEFKVKAAEVFEAVVTSRVSAEIATIEEELTEAANVEFEAQCEKLVENIDKYLSYVTENWMAENQIAVDYGLRNEITESFIQGMQKVFTEHYIEVPEEKYDVMTEMQTKIDSLSAKLDEEIESKIAIQEEAVTLKKQQVFAKISEGLASTEAEKFATLVEDITYTGMDSYEQKLQVVKENYFPSEDVVSEAKLEDTFEAADEVTNTVMSKYAQAISKATKF